MILHPAPTYNPIYFGIPFAWVDTLLVVHRLRWAVLGVPKHHHNLQDFCSSDTTSCLSVEKVNVLNALEYTNPHRNSFFLSACLFRKQLGPRRNSHLDHLVS
jgi:hypothetical protein